MGKEIIFDTFPAISKFNEIAGENMQFRSLNDPSIELQIKLIDEEVNDELQWALEKENLVGILDACADSIVVISGLIHKLGFKTQDVMNIINEANFSKFCDNEVDADLSVQWYEQNDNRYVDVHWKKIDDFYVIFGKKSYSDDSYKILKGINFVDPETQLKRLIEEKKGEV
jgi:hypothetical protein